MRLKAILLLIFLFIFPVFALNAGPISIIYTANINGALENCGCGSKPIGGIGRIKTFTDSFKKTHPGAILIDGGDFFNSYPFLALNQAMLEAMKLCAYDLIMPGDQAFIEGALFYREIESASKGKLLISNLKQEKSPVRTFKRGAYTIHIAAFLDPGAFEFVNIPKEKDLDHTFHSFSKKKSNQDFNILIFHGSRENAENFVAGNSDVDLILIAHSQERGIWNKEKCVIVGNGKDSEYVTTIAAEIAGTWQIKTNQVSMSDDYPEALEILDIIDHFKSQSQEK